MLSPQARCAPNCFLQEKNNEYIFGATEVGVQKPAARVKGRTLPWPEGIARRPYNCKRGQGLPHSHYPGTRDLTQAYIPCAGFFIGGTVQFLLGLYSLTLPDPKVAAQGVSEG